MTKEKALPKTDWKLIAIVFLVALLVMCVYTLFWQKGLITEAYEYIWNGCRGFVI